MFTLIAMVKPFSQFTKTALISNCSDKTYERGYQYFKKEHVEKIWVEDNKFYANVLGSYDSYNVLIEDNDSRFTYHCSCPFEGYYCKHVVAAGLALLAGKDALIKKAAQAKSFETQLERVCAILEEHNRYGGGPEEEEEEVWQGLNELVKLFQEKKLEPVDKRTFIDRMFHYYDWGNSGFTDDLVEAIFDVCDSREDWLSVIEKLEKKDSEYRKKLVMQIYKDKLNDEETYLRMRQHDLRFGTDYYDLVLFYQNKGNMEMAFTIAKKGAEIGEGRIIDLLEFLFNYYNQRDYSVALSYLKKIFTEEAGIEMYKKLKQFARDDDWATLDTWCRTVLSKQRKVHILARIHLDNKDYDQVLEYVLEKPTDVFFAYDFSDKESFAKQLIPLYPEKLLPFYVEKMNRCLEQMSRDNYKKAAHYAQFVKDIYIKYLHTEGAWKAFMGNIRKIYEKRPALLEEFNGLL